jgi:hypothetical protein
MTDVQQPSIWATISSPLLSVIAGVVTAQLIQWGARKDRISAELLWEDRFDPEGYPYSQPLLYLMNCGSAKVHIVSVTIRSGLFRMKVSRRCPVYEEAPEGCDLEINPFPKTIDPGQCVSFDLSSKPIDCEVKSTGRFAYACGRLWGRSRAVLEARTATGATARCCAEKGLHSSERPIWLVDPWWHR